MKVNGQRHKGQYGVGVALVAGLVGSVGCEPADSPGEPIGSVSQAITSIMRWDDLVAMGDTGSYRLDVNLNASGRAWTPKSFSGTFDGAGHTISNLTINTPGDTGFFQSLLSSTVTNVKFTNLRVTGGWTVGGIAGYSQDSILDRVVVEGTITASNGWSVGGITGYMVGGSITNSYAKGTVNGSVFYAAGGLSGSLFDSSMGFGQIYQSYAQVTVSPDTSDPNRIVYAGGIIGSGAGAWVYDVYAVGNVTGRGSVGGLAGYLSCNGYNSWLLYKGIYRGGDVVDRNQSGGWAGTVGSQIDTSCTMRFVGLFWDRLLDPSTHYNTEMAAQGRYTTTELKTPTTPIGGVYCLPDIIPERCGDNAFADPPWNAGDSNQHHTLRNMPGPNVQPTQ